MTWLMLAHLRLPRNGRHVAVFRRGHPGGRGDMIHVRQKALGADTAEVLRGMGLSSLIAKNEAAVAEW